MMLNASARNCSVARSPTFTLFAKHQIQIRQTWSDHSVLADIAECSRRRRGKRSGIEVPRRAPLIARQLPVDARDGIRPDEDTAGTRADTGRITLQIDRERESALQRVDTRHLPAAHDLAREPFAEQRMIRPERQAVNDAVHPSMLQVE